MNYKEYFRRFEEDIEYRNAKGQFGPILDIGDEVLRLRIEKSWSQAELAERAETKQANISRLESGLSNPSVNFLQKVAKALDTTISVRFEKITVPQVKIKAEAVNRSIYVPNWPQGKTYNYYHSSSTAETS